MRCPTFVERRVSDTVYEFKAVASGSSSSTTATTATTTTTSTTATVVTTTTSHRRRVNNSSISSTSRVVGRVFLLCTGGAALLLLMLLLLLLREWLVYQLCAAVAVGLALVAWLVLSQVTEESVLIIRDFGIQLQAKYVTGAEETTFLDKDRIAGVIIHEYIRGASVRYGLAFLMRGDDTDVQGGADPPAHAPQMPLSFGHVYPGLDNLTRVYRACAEMIHSSSAAAGAGSGSLWEY